MKRTDPGALRVARALARAAEAWGALALAHAVVAAGGLERFGRLLARHAAPVRGDGAGALLAHTWRAVDRAARLYPARVACLQRAAATVYLLRRRGVPADLVVGVRQAPFEAHAWVELDGAVVGTADDEEAAAAYAVIARV